MSAKSLTEKLVQLHALRNKLVHQAEKHNSFDVKDALLQLNDIGLRLPETNVETWLPELLLLFDYYSGRVWIPDPAIQAMEGIVRDRAPKIICDPSAGVGVLLGFALEASPASQGYAITDMPTHQVLGKALFPEVSWMQGSPFKELEKLDVQPDAVLSILSFKGRNKARLELQGVSGQTVKLKGSVGELMLAAAVARMAEDGTGLFIVTASFLLSDQSALTYFDQLGWGLEAALALPARAFYPQTNAQTYLVVIRKRPVDSLFAAQLTNDQGTNEQILANLANASQGGTIELGRFVPAKGFKGLDALRNQEKRKALALRYNAPEVLLQELATSVIKASASNAQVFPPADNAIYLSTVRGSSVKASIDRLYLERRTYFQVAIDPTLAKAAYVAGYLNTTIGSEVREGTNGEEPPELNEATLLQIPVILPELALQEALVEFEDRLATEEEMVVSIEWELGMMRHRVWADPGRLRGCEEQLQEIANRISIGLKERNESRLESWFDSLPFPLASILRAWQASPTHDHRAKHDHLIHFFEATAEFLSLILLSAFSANPQFFGPHKATLQRGLAGGKLSFDRASFGTWTTVVKTLGKQVRQLLRENGKQPDQAKADLDLCAMLFSDDSLQLPTILSKPEIADVIERTNSLRNNWVGHQGVLGNDIAAQRNVILLAQLQKLREAMEDLWDDVELIQGIHCIHRQGMFENELAILKGSNSEFLKETRPLVMPLDVERLYIYRRENATALVLLPLVHIGPSPASARNACYFFNRLEKEGVRFVSYHYADLPELTEAFEEAKATIQSLSKVD
jgi:hypothetical protein